MWRNANKRVNKLDVDILSAGQALVRQGQSFASAREQGVCVMLPAALGRDVTFEEVKSTCCNWRLTETLSSVKYTFPLMSNLCEPYFACTSSFESSTSWWLPVALEGGSALHTTTFQVGELTCVSSSHLLNLFIL